MYAPALFHGQGGHVQHTVFGQGGSRLDQGFGSCHHVTFLLAFSKHLIKEVVADGTFQFRQVVAFFS